jgi:cysteinyl-tRNA synthetase
MMKISPINFKKYYPAPHFSNIKKYNNNYIKKYYFQAMESFKKWIHPLEGLKDKHIIYRTGLQINNSLTNQKEEFITKDGGKSLNWYICGPTVYDAAHLGHARTYVSFDVLRRIMTTYFGYDVNMCMNITDIDDKIIKRALENNVEFEQFTRMWEEDFFKDMRALNVLYPNHITRVTEYIPEVIKFIQVLIEKNYAYESNGSVYFNIDSYTKNKHQYAKLVPSKIENQQERLESLIKAEGALSAGILSDKINPSDFALWKKSKKDEPYWNSPWGMGRPGWHIECSVMCSAIFGDSLDIHSGGVDLKFPHHDNEIAQTEGYYDNNQWVNYFIHTGHLNIDGLKMAKELKNFKKISEFIDKYNPNTFRLYFSSCRWDSTMDFTEKGLEEAMNNENYISEFFQNSKVWMRESDLKKNLKNDENDNNLNKSLAEKKQAIHEALIDNFNTPLVIKLIKELINKTYEYENKTRNSTFKIHIIYSVASYVSFIMKSFGLVYRTEFIDYFILDSSQQNSEQTLTPYIDTLTKFRDGIKTAASIDKDVVKILKLCDELRDDILPYLGIKIEDKGKGIPSIWKFYDKETYIKEIQKQKEVAESVKRKKEEEKKEKELKVKLIYLIS